MASSRLAENMDGWQGHFPERRKGEQIGAECLRVHVAA